MNYQYNIRGWLKSINDPATLGNDLFGMNLLYNEDHVLTGNAQYNGNISGYKWQSAHDNTMRNYGFSYDGLNRIKAADYASTDSKYFDVNNITYDRNGNILSLSRQGMLGTSGNFGLMDDLTYTYEDGNQLNRVDDSEQLHTYDADVPEFKELANTNDEYIYDDNGNMISDANKEISSILYNHLNLPIKVAFSNSQPDAEWTYDAAGMKVKKVYGDNIKWYIGGVEYSGSLTEPAEVEAIYHEEGRITPNGANWQFEYTLSDHLGNARVSFADLDHDGVINENSEILQTQSYYSFGLEHSVPNSPQVGTENRYKFNGYEEVPEVGWTDFGWRQYDPTIARWNRLDRFSEKYISISPFAFAANNPIKFKDVQGDSLWISINDTQVLYEDGKVFNSDGTDYKGKGVKVKKDGSLKYKGKLKSTVNALNSLSETEMGGDIISTLVSSENNFTINPSAKTNQFIPDDDGQYGTNLVTNNTYAIDVLQDGGKIADHLPFDQIGDGGEIRWEDGNLITLGHELGHAYDANSGLLTTKTTKVNGEYIEIRELRAVYYENKIREDLGQKMRENYSGGTSLLKNNQPIFHPLFFIPPTSF